MVNIRHHNITIALQERVGRGLAPAAHRQTMSQYTELYFHTAEIFIFTIHTQYCSAAIYVIHGQSLGALY